MEFYLYCVPCWTIAFFPCPIDSSRELKQKIEALRKNISNIHGDKSRVEKELNEMRQELERVSETLHEKVKKKREKCKLLVILEVITIVI